MPTKPQASILWGLQTVAAVAFALMISSCQSNDDQSNGNQSEATEAKMVKAPTIKVNGEMLPVVLIGDDTELLSIANLPPVGEWAFLVVRNVEGREFRAGKPTLLTGIRTMKFVRTPDGNTEFRVMEKKDEGEFIRSRMSMVEAVEIHKHGYTPPREKPPSLVLTKKGESTRVDELVLGTIKKTGEPGAKKEQETWLLRDLVGITKVHADLSILLRSSTGEEIVLSTLDLSDSDKQHFIKKNRRGQFHYRVWTTGDAPAQSSELRILTSIEFR